GTADGRKCFCGEYPHASLVFGHHDRMEVTADLLGEKGRSTESIPYADIVAFTCLKAFAFDPRNCRRKEMFLR
ncbi:hypothetical protein ACC695_39155, partial [Rhizobium ruizarguesonis]